MNDFTGFRFNNIHSKDLHLVVVSSGDRYDKNLLPGATDYTQEVPGGNGEYYFGSTFSKREFTIDVAFDSVDEKTWRKISNLFSTDKLCDLIFDELPYKTYRAKISNKPEFKFICFTDRDTKERVYKGEGTLKFVCYFPFAYGFNKYIIRAADKYTLKIPESIPIHDNRYENQYNRNKRKIYNIDTKEFYNVEKNMNTPWKGGYPTIEQVQAGELYFKDENGQDKIIDVRDYFKNVPEWAPSSKLLVTPTLDYDQDLIFLPQYSKINYINMDTGLNQENALIGSRLLVYNPGDLPVDFELKMDNNERTFGAERGDHFEIRRYNVQRLPIDMAVDFTGLKTQDLNEDSSYKYGLRYFKILTKDNDEQENVNIINGTDENGNNKTITIAINKPKYSLLEEKHPSHAFIAEPIPRERLGHFIRMFYWQSSLLKDTDGNQLLDFEEGIRLADRYEELYELCIDDYERYELYWKTLKEAILYKYEDASVFDDKDQSIEDFIYNYIHNPPEFIRKDFNLNYNQFNFNKTIMPVWFTEDYFDITSENIDKSTLFLDSEKQMLYNINNPEYEKSREDTYENFYKYKPTKEILNDNIQKGHWFKIPPGWSLIEVTPVCDEDIWGGKRWIDARPFNWGYGGINGEKQGIQNIFDAVYTIARKDYLTSLGKEDNEENLKFRSWYEDRILKAKEEGDNFAYEYYKTLELNAEYGFLKLLHGYWRIQKGLKTNVNGKDYVIKGHIEEWWWYACNYIWANFPPLYWGYADILNKAEIKYIPLFY